MNEADLNPATILQDSLPDCTVQSCFKVSGDGFRIRIDGSSYFCKIYTRDAVERVESEQHGLMSLSNSTKLRVPRVATLQAQVVGGRVLILEWLEFHNSTNRLWESLAIGLVELHSISVPFWGLEKDNFIGPSRQTNGSKTSWLDFFVKNRLIPQQRLASKNGLWQEVWSKQLDKTILVLDSIVPDEIEPGLCHGDLWTGNAGFVGGEPYVFDPAVYYGHYETDLAMAKLFGGFPSQFFDAYDNLVPRTPDFKERSDIYNLYHLINHLNIFGASYAGSVSQILKRYGS